MISRYFVILLALVAGVLRARDRAWSDSMGLFSLALGLISLRLADVKQNAVFKRIAWGFFVITLIAMGILIQRDYLR